MIDNRTVEQDTPEEAAAIEAAEAGHLQDWHALLLEAIPEEAWSQARLERAALQLRWLR